MFIYLQNSSYFFHIYKFVSYEQLIFLEGKEAYGLSLVNIKYISSKKAPFAGENVTMYDSLRDVNYGQGHCRRRPHWKSLRPFVIVVSYDLLHDVVRTTKLMCLVL